MRVRRVVEIGVYVCVCVCVCVCLRACCLYVPVVLNAFNVYCVCVCV